ncbi:MAG TPA: hypothetical protein VGM91_18445 [Conexibacter sp.]|jgi:hypothetical protein
MTAARAGFWLQATARGAEEVLAFAGTLAGTPAGRPGVSFGPLYTRATLNDLFQRARVEGNAMVDPHGYLVDKEHSKQRESRYPWLTQDPRPVTQAEWEDWMRASLQHQGSAALQGAGAPPTFLMSPSPVLTPAGGRTELHAVLDAAQVVRADVPAGSECWMSVMVDREYVMSSAHLTPLLNALLAARPEAVVFRATQKELPPVTVASYLSGLREAVEALASNGIDVFLPYSGWLGWMAMGWGAWGFSAGWSSGSWADRALAVGGNRPAVPPNYVFEAQLLRPVRWTVHEELRARDDYVACTCADCQVMDGVYDRDLAQRHQLRAVNAAAAELTAVGVVDRRAIVQARIAAAVAYRDGLPRMLRDRAEAKFLDTWADVA